jgi:predicted nucleotidyltransferase
MSANAAQPRLDAAFVTRQLDELRSKGVVRLDDDETAALAGALDSIEADSVELFGSRTDPAGRGGDIDLLILCRGAALIIARRIAVRFFDRCEEKIDVVVLDPSRLTAVQQVFLDSLQRVRVA